MLATSDIYAIKTRLRDTVITASSYMDDFASIVERTKMSEAPKANIRGDREAMLVAHVHCKSKTFKK